MNRNTLARGIQVVGILFAAFGGFFAGIAPPRTADAKFAVGISSFLVLILLFLVVALSKKKHPKAWIIVASCLFIIAVSAALCYRTYYDALTFEYPPGGANVEYVGGTELTPTAQDYKQQHPGISNSQLIAKFGGLQNTGKVWTEVSVNNARRKLIGSYMILVLTIAGAIFALTEGALVPARTRRR